jgi:hypothetical protein
MATPALGMPKLGVWRTETLKRVAVVSTAIVAGVELLGLYTPGGGHSYLGCHRYKIWVSFQREI